MTELYNPRAIRNWEFVVAVEDAVVEGLGIERVLRLQASKRLGEEYLY